MGVPPGSARIRPDPPGAFGVDCPHSDPHKGRLHQPEIPRFTLAVSTLQFFCFFSYVVPLQYIFCFAPVQTPEHDAERMFFFLYHPEAPGGFHLIFPSDHLCDRFPILLVLPRKSILDLVTRLAPFSKHFLFLAYKHVFKTTLACVLYYLLPLHNTPGR